MVHGLLCGIWDLSFPSRDRTHALCIGRWILNHRTPREVPKSTLDDKNIKMIQKEINPEYSLEGLVLRLQTSGHLMQRAESLEKTLMLGKIEGRRRRGWQKTRWLDGITDSVDMNLSKFQETVKDRRAWHVAVDRVEKSRTWLSDWTIINKNELMLRERGNPKTKTSNLHITGLPSQETCSAPNRKLHKVLKGDCLKFSVCISFTLKGMNKEKQKCGSVNGWHILREYCQDQLTLGKGKRSDWLVFKWDAEHSWVKMYTESEIISSG